MTLSFQDPKFPNGRITSFQIKIHNKKDDVRNGSGEWEHIPVNRTGADYLSSQSTITSLKKISQAEKKPVKVSVIALNSVGKSSEAVLGIPAELRGRCLCLL